MSPDTLFAALLTLALVETPNLKPETHSKYLAGMRAMTELYVAVGSAGELVSPDVDPLILAAIGYEESRHRPASKDGDCRYDASAKEVRCWSVGPMQLSRATAKWWRNVEPETPLTLEDLRHPETNVRVAYRMLRYWRDMCGGKVANWIGSWSAGKCFKSPIGLGKRRAWLAGAIGYHVGVEHAELEWRKANGRKHEMARIRALTKPD